MPAETDARAEEHGDNCTEAAGSQLRCIHGRSLTVRLEVMPPERFQPKNAERGADDCRLEHYLQRNKRLIPARRQAGQLLLNEIQLVPDLREVIAGLGGLAEGGAFEI